MIDAGTPLRRLAFVTLLALATMLVPGCTNRGGPASPETSTASDTPTPPVPGAAGAAGAVVLDEDESARQVFPADNWWNLDISAAPVDAASSAYIAWISGRTGTDTTAVRHLHPDFGPAPYGIPYIGVAGDQPLLPIHFSPYGSQSDSGAPGRPAGYPVPDAARTTPGYIEGGVAGGGASGDRHMLIIDRDHWLLFETWATHWNATLSRWDAGSGATWDLSMNGRRPDGWTSADAAGLAIFPGLVRYDEVYGATPAIRHAFRFTTRATNGHVWPASHDAGSTAGAPPMGTRLRLKSAVDISRFPAPMQRIFQAMKTYGLILADNGTDMYITGTMDARWDNDVLNPAFGALSADDFEVIQLGWNPTATGVAGIHAAGRSTPRL